MGELFDRVCSVSTLMDAWKRVKTKKSAGGIDGVSVEDVDGNVTETLSGLREALLKRTYAPEPLQRIHIPKMNGSGENRPLSLPSVKDKIVQQAVRSVIEPLFEAGFLDCSYAYRPGRGPQKLFKQVNHLLAVEKRHWVALGDFDRFFDTLDQDFMIRQFRRVVDDGDIIRLVRMWLKTGFVSRKGDYFDVEEGVGQGSVISPLLSNIYAHPLDDSMTRQGCAFVRYSDNFIILCHDRKEAISALEKLQAFSRDVLHLKLNQNLQPVKNLEHGFVFLGIYYRSGDRAISTGKMIKNRKRIEKATRPGIDPKALMEGLGRSLAGVRRYYEVIHPEKQFAELDDHLQRRMIAVLVAYIRKGFYRNTEQLMIYLSDLEFLSDAYTRTKEERLRELAVAALKQHMVEGEAKERAKPLKTETKGEIQSADRAVSRKKKRYLTAHALESEIVVSTHGAFLGKTGDCLVVKMSKRNLLTRPLEKVESVTVIGRGVALSSDLISECTQKKIPISFIDARGTPYALIHPPLQPRTKLALLQLEAQANGTGLQIARRIVLGKIRNQMNLMKFYARSREDEPEFVADLKAMESDVEGLVQELEATEQEQDKELLRSKLFSIEGRAASTYWALVRKLLGENAPFPGRKRQGAEDLVNCLLNYGYGMLYARMWKYLAMAGLNPYISFLHSPQQDKPTLAFDLIEEFRCQAVDRAVFTMITRGEELMLDGKEGLLTEETKRKLAQNVLERLSTPVPYKGKRYKLDDVIRFQARHMAACLEKRKPYRSFIGRY